MANPFTKKIFDRGLDIVRNNKIKEMKIKHDKIVAVVNGTHDYTVKMDIKRNQLTNLYCNCPYAQDHDCKHMAAIFISYNKGVREIKNGRIIKRVAVNEKNYIKLFQSVEDICKEAGRMTYSYNKNSPIIYYQNYIDNYFQTINEIQCLELIYIHLRQLENSLLNDNIKENIYQILSSYLHVLEIDEECQIIDELFVNEYITNSRASQILNEYLNNYLNNMDKNKQIEYLITILSKRKKENTNQLIKQIFKIAQNDLSIFEQLKDYKDTVGYADNYIRYLMSENREEEAIKTLKNVKNISSFDSIKLSTFIHHTYDDYCNAIILDYKKNENLQNIEEFLSIVPENLAYPSIDKIYHTLKTMKKITDFLKGKKMTQYTIFRVLQHHDVKLFNTYIENNKHLYSNDEYMMMYITCLLNNNTFFLEATNYYGYDYGFRKIRNYYKNKDDILTILYLLYKRYQDDKYFKKVIKKEIEEVLKEDDKRYISSQYNENILY